MMEKPRRIALVFLGGLLAGLSLRLDATRAQTAPPDTDPKGRRRSVFEAGEISGNKYAFWTPPGTTPLVMPITSMPILKNMKLSNEIVSLDGLDCRSCTFDNAHLTYGGGAINLTDARFEHNVTVEYIGAAANTLATVKLLQELQTRNPAVTQPASQKPITKKTIIRKAPTKPLSWQPPYIK